MCSVRRLTQRDLRNMSAKMLNFKILRRQFSSLLRQDVWTQGVIKSPFKDVVIPKMNVDEYVWPTKSAMVCGVTNRSYTYEELYKHSRTFGANLRKKFKLENGDTVAVMMRNVPEYPIVVLGIMSAGGVATTFNRFILRKDITFVQGYGLTEASPMVSLGTKDEKNYRSVGYALPNIQLRVVNEQMDNLGPNEVRYTRFN